MELEQIDFFNQIEFLAKKLVDGFITGKHKSPYHGFSVEFAEHRNYNVGDTIKHIDWKVFAKTDKLMIKKYDEETNLKAHIVIDTSSSMYYPPIQHKKIKYTCMAAAALSLMLQKQKDAFCLHTFDASLHTLTDIKSTRTHLRNLYTHLSMIAEDKNPLQKKADITNALHTIAEKAGKRNLILFFTDFLGEQEKLEALMASLQHIKHNHHDLILFHVMDFKDEVELDLPNKPFWLTDSETNEKIKIYPTEIKSTYKDNISAYFDLLKIKCGDFGIDFVPIDINEPIDQVLQPFLLKRSKLY
jgi:uncharacterized protein (DUF58 family)